MRTTLILLTTLVALTIALPSAVADICVSGNGAGSVHECRRVGDGDVCVEYDGVTETVCIPNIRLE